MDFNLRSHSPYALQVPEQIELFARHPVFALADEGSVVTPLHFDETISSLSAIILDDGYYEFIQSHVTQVEGIPLLSALHIIPLKMRAHIDLGRKHRAGAHVNKKDLTKHRMTSQSYRVCSLQSIPCRSRAKCEKTPSDSFRTSSNTHSGKPIGRSVVNLMMTYERLSRSISVHPETKR